MISLVSCGGSKESTPQPPPPAQTFRISGSSGVPGASVTVTGSKTVTTTTADDGNFSVSGLSSGDYLVSISLANYQFTPDQITVTIRDSNVSVHFDSARILLLHGSVGVGSAKMTLTGPVAQSFNLNTTGNYKIPITKPGTYTLQPSKHDYIFNPPSQTVTLTKDDVEANFTAAHVSTVAGNVGIGGASLSLQGDKTFNAVSDTFGNYSIPNVVAGTYTLSVSHRSDTFSPSSKKVDVADTDVTVDFSPQKVNADVVVYAATPSGIAAAIESEQLGKSTVLLEPSKHVGGMTTNGLGTTDFYGTQFIGGITMTFLQTVDHIYHPQTTSTKGWLYYEPHVAENAFIQMLLATPNLSVIYDAAFASINKMGTSIRSLTATNGILYTGKEFVDASYEGDVMAAAGVSYIVGREPDTQYNEPLGGRRDLAPIGQTAVDPYVVQGDPSSGLLPHVVADHLPPVGSGDNSLMAYTYRLCVSTIPSNQIPFTPPEGYDPKEFEGIGRFADAARAQGVPLPKYKFIGSGGLPTSKWDINSSGPISTDDVGAGVRYPDASPEERKQIAAEHKRYMQGVIYFLKTDPRIPADVQKVINTWGLCKDEFTDNGGWPRQLYIREARRMIGVYVMTQADALKQTSIPDSIGLGGWDLDSHETNRVAKDNLIQDEYFQQQKGSVGYPIPYRSLTPVKSEADNLLVTVTMSASHVAYTSLRVEPTYMIMGQAAGAAASLAIDANAAVQDVDYDLLSSQLKKDGAILAAP